MLIAAMDLRISHLIDDISCGGVHPETARARVSSYAKNGLIWFRAGINTSPNLYRIDDAAAAVVLSALQDCGIADLDIQRDVCCEIYLRIRRCLAGLAKGESWSMVIDIYRDGSSGRFVVPSLAPCDRQTPLRLPVEFTPRGAIVVVLDEMLSPVLRRLSKPKGH